MTLHLLRPATVLGLTCTMSMAAVRPDRRVVDVVEVGNAQSDAAHGYAGNDANVGMQAGRPFRQTRGWLHYTLTTFDDTEVTVQCTFVDAGPSGVPRSFDLVVEDSVVAARTVIARSSMPTIVAVTVPLSVTKGKTRIVVVLRARDGLSPALRELRTIQDHYEVDAHP